MNMYFEFIISVPSKNHNFYKEQKPASEGKLFLFMKSTLGLTLFHIHVLTIHYHLVSHSNSTTH